MRKELRKRGIDNGVTVVYSTAPDLATKASRDEPLGSSSIVPPLFGLTMAGTVLQALLAWEVG